jgi:5'-nucleotidase (lipoprotein e(P4) family)
MTTRHAHSLAAILLCLTALSCAHSAPPTAGAHSAPPTAGAPAAPLMKPGHELLQSTLWMQSSVEYRAAAKGTYVAATRMLDLALADPSWSAMPHIPHAPDAPPAVILDIDETCVDNVIYAVDSIRAGQVHTTARFAAFVRSGRVAAVPGAREFLEYAHARGVAVFYVTNQRHDIEEPTRRNLVKLGFPVDAARDSVLTVGERPEWESGDKEPRRAHVAATHRVLLMLGDDFNDFVTAAEKTADERNALYERHAGMFGTKWFMLPNPVYGSWERAIVGRGMTPDDAFRTKLDALRD